MKNTLLLDALLDAMETNNNQIKWYFDKGKEKFLLVTDEFIEDDLEIEEIESNDVRFIPLPSEHEIYEHSIMVEFSNEQTTEIQDVLLKSLYRKGAFRKFKDAVFEMGIREQWFVYKREKLTTIANAWANKYSIAIVTKEKE